MDSPVRLGDWMYVWISYLKFIVLCYVRAQQFLIVINRRGNEPIYDKIYVVFSYYLLGVVELPGVHGWSQLATF